MSRSTELPSLPESFSNHFVRQVMRRNAVSPDT